MYDKGTLIRSSIISLIIVSIGLFLLCVSRAPKIDTNQGAVNGGNSKDPDILALLNEADGELSQSQSDSDLSNAGAANTETSSNSDDELNSLLSEANDVFASSNSDTKSDDKEMEDLMQLLGTDESQTSSMAASDANSAYQSSDNQPDEDLNQLLGASTSSATDSSSITTIRQEIEKLESVLAEKNSLKQQLKQQIDDYDKRIADLESRLTNPMSDANFYAGTQQTTEYGYSETGSSNNISLSSSGMADDYEIAYKDALQMFYDHHYQDAARQFFDLLQINPDHPLADNCQYWIGECYYAQRKYYQAIAEFNKVAAFNAGDKKDDAQLMLGLCFLRLGDKDLAQTELNWLVDVFASSEYVSKAYHYLNRL